MGDGLPPSTPMRPPASRLPRAVRVRDTKDACLGPILLLDHAAWTGLRAAALIHRPGTAFGVTIAHDERRTHHAGTDVVTTWHIAHGGRTLHFTDGEWGAFAAGVREGEFDFAPVVRQ